MSTIRQMNDDHHSLLDVQDVMLSLKFDDDPGPSPDRMKMIGQILAYLLAKRTAVEGEENIPPRPELVKSAVAS